MDELRSMLKEIHASFPEYVGELKTHFLEAADLWKVGKDGEALKVYLMTLEAYDTFLKLLSLFIEKGGAAQEEKTDEVQSLLVSATEKVRDAMEAEDYTLLPDVLEYELIPALEEVLNIRLNPELEEQ